MCILLDIEMIWTKHKVHKTQIFSMCFGILGVQISTLSTTPTTSRSARQEHEIGTRTSP